MTFLEVTTHLLNKFNLLYWVEQVLHMHIKKPVDTQ